MLQSRGRRWGRGVFASMYWCWIFAVSDYVEQLIGRRVRSANL